jgi:hypothetical protein
MVFIAVVDECLSAVEWDLGMKEGRLFGSGLEQIRKHSVPAICLGITVENDKSEDIPKLFGTYK